MLEHFGLMPSYFRHKTQFGSKEQSSQQKAAILSMMSILSIQSTNSIILSIHSVMRYSEHFRANFWGPSLWLKNFTHKHTKAKVYHLLRAENKKYLRRWPWYKRVLCVCVFFLIHLFEGVGSGGHFSDFVKMAVEYPVWPDFLASNPSPQKPEQQQTWPPHVAVGCSPPSSHPLWNPAEYEQ